MSAALELVLEHDGHDWLAHGAGLTVRATELAELDRALARALPADTTAAAVTVHMRFKWRSLPAWTHQYMPHYFNRTVHLYPQQSAESSA